jgi:hypothetical protein
MLKTLMLLTVANLDGQWIQNLVILCDQAPDEYGNLF